jgi:hypothetical protein
VQSSSRCECLGKSSQIKHRKLSSRRRYFLTGVYDLNITGFKGNNISFLKNVKILNITSCLNLTSLDPVGRQLEELHMVGCPLINNITMLHKVRRLEFSCDSKITNFTGLNFLEELTISRPRASTIPFCVLEGIETFKRIKLLRVNNKVDDIEKVLSSLPNPGELSLRNLILLTDSFSSLSRYKKLKYLCLMNCTVPFIVPKTLVYLHYLKISFCSNV